jgi:hypothetical protein
MKSVWKWVIGIVIVLLVVAAVVGGVFILRSHFSNVVSYRVNRPSAQVPGPNYVQPSGPGRFPGMIPFGNNGWRGYGMRGPGMMSFGGFNIIGGLIRGLFTLGFLALVVLGIVWLVTRLRRPMAPVAAVVSGAVAAPVAPIAATHPCPKCGEPVQDNWHHCPNCGEKL